MPLIHGTLAFEGAQLASLAGASGHVRLLDDSAADGASVVVGEMEIEALPAGADTSRSLPFAFQIGDLDPARSYTLWARIGTTGSRIPSAGDHITMESFPVNATDANQPRLVRLRKIPA